MKSDAVLQKLGNRERHVPTPTFCVIEYRYEAFHVFPENNMNHKVYG